MVVINSFSAAGKIGFGSNKHISDKWAIPITPDGYAFTIWGVIWLSQAVFVFYSLLPIDRIDKHSFLLASAPISSLWIGQFLWCFPFNYDIQSVALILFIYMFACAIFIYSFFYYAHERMEWSDLPIAKKFFYWFIFHFHIGVNTAWICCAFIVQFFISFKSAGIEVPNAVYIGALALLVFAGIIICTFNTDLAFTGTLVWALVAIYRNPRFTFEEIQLSCLILIVFTIASSLLVLIINCYKRSRPPYQPLPHQLGYY